MNPGERTEAQKREYKIGWLCAVSCGVIWGGLPIYWKQLDFIMPVLAMFYRLSLACLLVFLIDLKIYGWKQIVEPLKERGALWSYLLSGGLISINWSLYIYMVNVGKVIQTSIGYYIEPLVIAVFGLLFFREKFDRYKAAALGLAVIGVLIMVLSYGQLPVLALLLAVSFGGYAVVKKKVNQPAMLALFYETLVLLPLAVGFILFMELTGRGAFTTATPVQLGWLSLSGLVTALPLVLFAMAANRIPLIELGLSGYLSPSVALLLGIFLFGEGFDIYQFIGFCVIWVGLAIFTAGNFIYAREQTPGRGV